MVSSPLASVLFVRVHNAGRSQMAAGFLTHLAGELIEVCGDVRPVFPGRKYLDRDLEDPAGQGVEAVRTIGGEIRTLVEGLIAEAAPEAAK
ncbi:hypothetical protein ACFO9E_05840 [Streptomyces maoxianensis]|uniref:Phosphotyrosine protein phosphatase I domain-containing protein n=1 Tax=Streptomyces maoxianensis TaxID=1459942 RepID=A0ABV9G3Z9_9ACTN